MRFPVLFLSGLCLALAQEPPAHQKLISTLWVQTSVEWQVSCRQSFLAARHALDASISDPSSTAAIEQAAHDPASLRNLPLAIIVDVDETVLDNAPSQARQVKAGVGFDLALWNQWVSESKADPMPGAAEFSRYAAARGVTIFYVTNRDANQEAATRSNLRRHGFPLSLNNDTVLCRSERTEWSSDKSTRRSFIGATHRILLLIGDDLGDFLPGARTTAANRQILAAPYQEYWGRKWFLIPNPSYGSWEDAIYNVPKPQDPGEQLKQKLSALRP
ncbi:MAG: hypothetical protein JJE04_26045 [Acidobacteriia bacterium]|nr:hypothetical protein [Terriglobia bacterium]